MLGVGRSKATQVGNDEREQALNHCSPRFSGADLANVINEAALLSARRNATGVTFGDFEAAIERVGGGLGLRSQIMNAKERETVAFHAVLLG